MFSAGLYALRAGWLGLDLGMDLDGIPSADFASAFSVSFVGVLILFALLKFFFFFLDSSFSSNLLIR